MDLGDESAKDTEHVQWLMSRQIVEREHIYLTIWVNFNVEGVTNICKESLSQELPFETKMKAIGVSVVGL